MYRILSPTVAAIIAATTLGGRRSVAAASDVTLWQHRHASGAGGRPVDRFDDDPGQHAHIDQRRAARRGGAAPVDARPGRIRDTQTTDRAGLFAFHSVEPGTYVVEIVGDDQTILAASQMLNVDAGDTVSAVVKLPFRIPLMGGLLGHTVQSATAIAVAAAASGVLAAKVTTQITPQ